MNFILILMPPGIAENYLVYTTNTGKNTSIRQLPFTSLVDIGAFTYILGFNFVING